MKPGIVILAELQPELAERILGIQRRYDPKLAATLPPHITLTGSSGMGPIPVDTTPEQLRVALEPVARDTPPLTLEFSRPMQFMQSQVVVLPLDPHGPIRVLHDRILTSGLRYEQPRFTFTPHVTLNLFRELPPAELRDLLRVRIAEPVRVEKIAAWRSTGMLDSRIVLELPLTGVAP